MQVTQFAYLSLVAHFGCLHLFFIDSLPGSGLRREREMGVENSLRVTWRFSVSNRNGKEKPEGRGSFPSCLTVNMEKFVNQFCHKIVSLRSPIDSKLSKGLKDIGNTEDLRKEELIPRAQMIMQASIFALLRVTLGDPSQQAVMTVMDNLLRTLPLAKIYVPGDRS